MTLLKTKLGIDLGTTNTLVFIPKKGIVVNEPTVIAASTYDNKIVAVGNHAKEMIGRSPESIIVTRPMKDGVIADYKITKAMLKYFIKKATGVSIFKPDIIISVPAGITSAERRAVLEAALNSGAKNVYLVKEPVLAAIGAKIPINSAYGHMIVNIGGGTTEVAVISLGGIVSWASQRIGGNKLDYAIVEYMKKKYGLAIGERTAEQIKTTIGSAIKETSNEKLGVRGRDLTDGLPKTIDISSSDVSEAIQEQLRDIIQTIKTVLQDTPPELCADVIERGIILSGGGALLRNIDVLITKITGVPSRVADDPLFCVAKGTGIILQNLDFYTKNLATKR